MPARRNRQELRFHHAAINVPDLNVAIQWYRQVLCFEEERRFEIPAANATIAMLRRGDLRVEIFATPNAQPLPPERRDPRRDLETHGNKHVAFASANLEELKADLKSRGADVCYELPGPPRGFFVRDCAGNLIEFLEDS